MGVGDIKYSYMILDSPLVNTFENLYGPPASCIPSTGQH
jgi:hypothetical protein